MTRMGGLLRKMPFYGTALVMGFMASCGLPGFANFAGEATVLFGSWKSLPWLVIIAAWSGLIIGAVAMLRALRAVLQGPERPEFSRVVDTGYWRRLPFVVLLSAMVLFGVAPGILTSRIEPAAKAVLATHLTPSHAGQAPAVPAAPAASAPGQSGH
jgi:NADH-quinone oxidoreductase subunit M